MNEKAVARVRAGGMPELRPVYMTLMPHLDLEGTRLTGLAERMGISKQAVSQIVDELEEMGVVERRRDPSDGRARLTRKIGSGQMQRLRRARVSLLRELEKPG